MPDIAQIAEDINILAGFCGPRDIAAPDSASLQAAFGIEHADVFVLFGGSVLAGGDVLARAMAARIARTYVIVGGEGHTTETLRSVVRSACPDIDTAGQPEAVVFQRYLEKAYGLRADLLETRSTNCGNNITNLLALLKAHSIDPRSVILCQDATMQRRMDATLRRHAPRIPTVIDYAAYRATVTGSGGRLRYAEPISGMWDMDRYVRLLMGEIPRLRDDEDGYGPRGKGFIAHVDIPECVTMAFERLKAATGVETRPADPRYA